MRVRRLLTLAVAASLLAACTSSEIDSTPTRTPRPTITSTAAPAPASTDTAAAPTTVAATPTPLEAVSGPTQTILTNVNTPTGIAPTPTTRALIPRPTPQPLDITNVLLIGVERDPTRDGGAIASLQVVYSGGRAPYRIYHDDTEQPENPFKVLTLCDGTIVHTIRLTSGDGQSVTKKYYLSPIKCPP